MEDAKGTGLRRVKCLLPQIYEARLQTFNGLPPSVVRYRFLGSLETRWDGRSAESLLSQND